MDKEELSHGKREGYTYLILCTISGVAAGLQNTVYFVKSVFRV